jgi:hypothetical protein
MYVHEGFVDVNQPLIGDLFVILKSKHLKLTLKQL